MEAPTNSRRLLTFTAIRSTIPIRSQRGEFVETGGVMTQRNQRLDPGKILDAEREKALASAVRRRAKNVYFLERAFEEVGCSCGVLRQQLRELEAQQRAEHDRIELELTNSALSREISDVRQKIYDIDRAEHHTLDRTARQAYSFLSVWLLDQVRAGNTDLLDLGDDDLGRKYAEAWYGGWRPKRLPGTSALSGTLRDSG